MKVKGRRRSALIAWLTARFGSRGACCEAFWDFQRGVRL